MKQLFAILALLAIFVACSKQDTPQNPTASRWGTVADKFYSDSFPFISPPYPYRRYWVHWAHDTTCTPANPNCGRDSVVRITFACYDTLFRNRYPERLPESAFIPAYPY